MKKILAFSELPEIQLNRITKGNLISPSKCIIQENSLTFLNDEYGAS